MHCPGCGHESSLDQKFCRKCGFNLEPVGKLFKNESGPDERKRERAEREKQAVRRMVSWMMWGMLVMLIGVILTVVNKQLKLDQPVGLIATFIILAGVSATMYGLLDAMRGGKQPRKSKKLEGSRDDLPPVTEIKADTTRELAGGMPIPVPSVTERTTNLIGEKAKRE